mgnify:FL=1
MFGQDGFELLQDILEDAGELKERTPYAELVNTEFAQMLPDDLLSLIHL